jgi:HlyD family secretion protein
MSGLSRRRVVEGAAAVIVVAAVVWFAWPSAVPVDIAVATQGPMEVTIDEEARTRVRHVYAVSAPLTGTAQRVDREVGDAVTANQTVVAIMRPAAPGFHDPRMHQELQSALTAADAAVSLADAERRRIEAALNLARTELTRMKALTGQGAVSQSALDKANAEAQADEAALASAVAAVAVRRNERAIAAARLKNPGDEMLTAEAGCCIQIRSPVTGQILSRVQESEAVVPAGTLLVTIGDPTDLEIVAELLSTDAVQVHAGDAVRIDGWGGAPLQGRVRRVEPAGFLKVSALGIEEQRVRTIIDITDPPQNRGQLGHDYRVIAHIVVWNRDKVLTVPVGALFHVGDDWAVFREVDGRARTTVVKLGQRNRRVAEVISGLRAGQHVVVHASDRVSDGIRITAR